MRSHGIPYSDSGERDPEKTFSVGPNRRGWRGRGGGERDEGTRKRTLVANMGLEIRGNVGGFCH